MDINGFENYFFTKQKIFLQFLTRQSDNVTLDERDRIAARDLSYTSITSLRLNPSSPPWVRYPI